MPLVFLSEGEVDHAAMTDRFAVGEVARAARRRGLKASSQQITFKQEC
jgi:hypothetical protein